MLWEVCMMFLCEYAGYEYVNFGIMIRTRTWKFMISLVRFTQGDYVMLILQKKGYDERKILILSKRAHYHVIQGDNILWPIISLLRKITKGYFKERDLS